MKIALSMGVCALGLAIAATTVLAPGASAQNIPAPTGSAVPPAMGTASASDAGCGPEKESFEVKSDDKNHPVSEPPAGLALVYFIQDDTDYWHRPRPTTRWGLDGDWLGATQANAYFYMAVKPGPHQLCVIWQNAAINTYGRKASATAWAAKAGETYYFVAQNMYWENPTGSATRLGLIVPEEAELRMSKFAYSTFTPKK
ncbi:MAG: hypothetical protein WA823_08930 [Candidatus Acidiferrales bacterium]